MRLERGKYYSAPIETRYAVREAQEYRCADCGRECDHNNGDKLEVHHIVPECRGGTDDEDNLVGLCGPEGNNCHEKWDKLAFEKGEYFEK